MVYEFENKLQIYQKEIKKKQIDYEKSKNNEIFNVFKKIYIKKVNQKSKNKCQKTVYEIRRVNHFFVIFRRDKHNCQFYKKFSLVAEIYLSLQENVNKRQI